jgi:2-polyprenyl-6-methoxyphenol hydroxylase-like FAD-dependent oxidoreductase
MRTKSVLVSGAGIAGVTLAYWLMQHGYEPILIERASAFRAGGYMIDFWGLGYEVADRMGLVPRLRSEGYFIREIRFVDGSGSQIGRFGADAMRAVLGENYLSILRGDLASRIYETINSRVEVIYGESIKGIEQTDTGVRVAFEHSSPREVGLLVGADGLHSIVRQISFGNGSFEKDLGYYAASFLVDHYPWRDETAYVCYSTPGKQVARYALRGDRTAFFFFFAADTKLDAGDQSEERRKDFLRDTFADDGWECPQIVTALDTCNEFYFDRVSQVRLDRWSDGRVALVGDAAFCPSLLAGEGASLAMTAAYILAGELKKAGGDHRIAFLQYESIFRPLIEQKQRSAERFAAWFAPKTSFGLYVRNATTQLMSVPFLANWFMRGMISDQLALPEYSV